MPRQCECLARQKAWSAVVQKGGAVTRRMQEDEMSAVCLRAKPEGLDETCRWWGAVHQGKNRSTFTCCERGLPSRQGQKTVEIGTEQHGVGDVTA